MTALARRRLRAQWGLLRGHYADYLARFFANEGLRQTMSFPALMLGQPPWRLSAAVALYLYHELTAGRWRPFRGLGRLTQALASAFERAGGESRTGAAAERILVRDRRVVAVRLAAGAQINSRYVVANVHAATTYLDLVGREHLPRRAGRRLERLENAGAGVVLQLGLDFEPQGPPVTVMTPGRQKEARAFWERLEQGALPETLYPLVMLPGQGGGRVAEPGQSVVHIYHPVPAQAPPPGWQGAFLDELVGRLLARAEEALSSPLAGHIVPQRVLTPPAFARQWGLRGGALFGLRPNRRGLFLRPANRSPWLKGLYLTGQTTYPPLGGVAGAMSSGVLTAGLVLKALGQEPPRLARPPGQAFNG